MPGTRLALDEDIRVLSRVRLFDGFTEEQLRLLAFGAETANLAAERKLYREEDVADCAYVVVRGRIGLYRERNGERTDIGTAGPGEILGELALIAETQRLTSAAALTDATVLKLDRKPFHRILEAYPDVAIRLHARISRDLQAMARRIEALAPHFRD